MSSPAAPSAMANLPTVSIQGRTRHIAFLDHVRGVAILAVFFCHAFDAAFHHDPLPWNGWHRRLPSAWLECLFAPAALGWAGVAVFFVVSGFCIHLSFTCKPDWKDFWMRRFFRIYPPYLLALSFFAFVLPLTRLDLHAKQAWVQLGTHLALIHNFGNTTLGGINGSFWTIAVEAQLYFLYPLLMLLVRRLGWERTLALTAVIEAAFRLALYAWTDRALAEPFKNVPRLLTACPLGFWFSWSIGAYLAECYLRGTVHAPARFLPPGVLLLLAVGADMVWPLIVFSFPLFALCTAGVMARALTDGGVRWRLPRFLSRYLAETGLWSYSIYLLHQPLLVWLGIVLPTRLPPALNTPAVVFGFVLSAFFLIKPLSGAWYHVCELKAIALGKRMVAATAVPA